MGDGASQCQAKQVLENFGVFSALLEYTQNYSLPYLQCKVDLLTGIGLSVSVPMISYIISGLAASGGSKAAHELIAKFRAIREDINE